MNKFGDEVKNKGTHSSFTIHGLVHPGQWSLRPDAYDNNFEVSSSNPGKEENIAC